MPLEKLADDLEMAENEEIAEILGRHPHCATDPDDLDELVLDIRHHLNSTIHHSAERHAREAAELLTQIRRENHRFHIWVIVVAVLMTLALLFNMCIDAQQNGINVVPQLVVYKPVAVYVPTYKPSGRGGGNDMTVDYYQAQYPRTN